MVASITDFSLRKSDSAEFVPKPNYPFYLVIFLAPGNGVIRYRASALFWCGASGVCTSNGAGGHDGVGGAAGMTSSTTKERVFRPQRRIHGNRHGVYIE